MTPKTNLFHFKLLASFQTFRNTSITLGHFSPLVTMWFMFPRRSTESNVSLGWNTWNWFFRSTIISQKKHTKCVKKEWKFSIHFDSLCVFFRECSYQILQIDLYSQIIRNKRVCKNVQWKKNRGSPFFIVFHHRNSFYFYRQSNKRMSKHIPMVCFYIWRRDTMHEKCSPKYTQKKSEQSL